MDDNTNAVVVIGPCEPVNFSIYRITIGEYVYIGHTQDIHDRALRHASDARRTIGKLFRESNCDMFVEHIDEAHSKDHAREVEQKHIALAKEEHGHKLLNVQHARRK